MQRKGGKKRTDRPKKNGWRTASKEADTMKMGKARAGGCSSGEKGVTEKGEGKRKHRGGGGRMKEIRRGRRERLGAGLILQGAQCINRPEYNQSLKMTKKEHERGFVKRKRRFGGMFPHSHSTSFGGPPEHKGLEVKKRTPKRTETRTRKPEE